MTDRDAHEMYSMFYLAKIWSVFWKVLTIDKELVSLGARFDSCFRKTQKPKGNSLAFEGLNCSGDPVGIFAPAVKIAFTYHHHDHQDYCEKPKDISTNQETFRQQTP